MAEKVNPYTGDRRPNSKMFQLEFGITIDEAIAKMDELLDEYQMLIRQMDAQRKEISEDHGSPTSQETTDSFAKNGYRYEKLTQLFTELQHRLYGSLDYDRLNEGLKKAHEPE